MKVKCEYCGSMIEDKLDVCPNCGSPNKNVRRTVDKTPKTIEELQQWYQDRNLPPYETTRFFIGENYQGKRAFGIYRDGDEVIVYKNKDDGTRAIRYQGTDEAYGVNELYLKLKSEILNQKSRQKGGKGGAKNAAIGCRQGCLSVIVSVLMMIVFGLVSAILFAEPILTIAAVAFPIVVYVLLCKAVPSVRGSNSTGLISLIYIIYLVMIFAFIGMYAIKSHTPVYYNYNGDVYVEYDHDYYWYDSDAEDYSPVDSLPAEVQSNPSDYEYDYSSDNWDSSYSFKDSDYYNDNLASDDYSSDDYDSGYDWDSGSDWDSGGSDWGSDW